MENDETGQLVNITSEENDEAVMQDVDRAMRILNALMRHDDMFGGNVGGERRRLSIYLVHIVTIQSRSGFTKTP